MAVSPCIAEINNQADRGPSQKHLDRAPAQADEQQGAARHRQGAHHPEQRRLKGPMPPGVAPAQYHHSQGHHEEREQRAGVRDIRER